MPRDRNLQKNASQMARIKRWQNAVAKRYQAGEEPETSKELAALLDKMHGTNFVTKYHSKNESIMKKSELRQLIREEIQLIREAGLPTQRQIDRNKKGTELFLQAQKAYKELLAFFKKWDRQVGGDDPTKQQYAAAEKAYQKAFKDIKPFLDYDDDAKSYHGTAASKLYKNARGTLDGIKYMLYGD